MERLWILTFLLLTCSVAILLFLQKNYEDLIYIRRYVKTKICIEILNLKCKQPRPGFELGSPISVTERIYIYPTPPHEQDATQGQFLKRSLTGFNSEFSFS